MIRLICAHYCVAYLTFLMKVSFSKKERWKLVLALYGINLESDVSFKMRMTLFCVAFICYSFTN